MSKRKNITRNNRKTTKILKNFNDESEKRNILKSLKSNQSKKSMLSIRNSLNKKDNIYINKELANKTCNYTKELSNLLESLIYYEDNIIKTISKDIENQNLKNCLIQVFDLKFYNYFLNSKTLSLFEKYLTETNNFLINITLYLNNSEIIKYFKENLHNNIFLKITNIFIIICLYLKAISNMVELDMMLVIGNNSKLSNNKYISNNNNNHLHTNVSNSFKCYNLVKDLTFIVYMYINTNIIKDAKFSNHRFETENIINKTCSIFNLNNIKTIEEAYFKERGFVICDYNGYIIKSDSYFDNVIINNVNYSSETDNLFSIFDNNYLDIFNFKYNEYIKNSDYDLIGKFNIKIKNSSKVDNNNNYNYNITNTEAYSSINNVKTVDICVSKILLIDNNKNIRDHLIFHIKNSYSFECINF